MESKDPFCASALWPLQGILAMHRERPSERNPCIAKPLYFTDSMIILMAGLPGTGKSTLARDLAACTSGLVLSKDEIRSALFRAAEIEYSIEQDDFCQQ